ncbi:MAG: VTT domain-containing protein [Dehalococcoidia bacterium]|nr:MAG: VTT domain-containing protein [Dehalococcoidia bacterium]
MTEQRKGNTKITWLRYVFLFIILIVVSVGLIYLLQYLVDSLDLPLERYAALSYFIVFLVQVISNLALFPTGPPVATSVMIIAATQWNPILVALSASIGGTIGELSGYYVGYLGRKSPLITNTRFYEMVNRWMDKYGVWTITLLAFQPVIPFDVGGIAAGTAKMPLRKFLPALWIGKFPKYILICYAGIGLIDFLPFM